MSVDPEHLYEQTLVVRSQMGDEAGFGELLNLFGPRLLRFNERMLQSSPDQVADLTQEIWVAIFRALPGLRDASKFRAWAFRIARDRIYREYRRRKLQVQSLDETNLEALGAMDEEEVGVDAEELRHCLQAIGLEHREVLALRFLEGQSYEDIARATGVTIGTVRSRIYYGKRSLRSAWEKSKL